MPRSDLEVVLSLTSDMIGGAAEAARTLRQIGTEIDDLGKKAGIFSGLQMAAKELEASLKGISGEIATLNLGLGGIAQRADQGGRAVQGAAGAISNLRSVARQAAGNVGETAAAAENLGAKAETVRNVAAATGEVADISDKARSSFMS